MKVWQKTTIITIVLFFLGVLGAGWVYRPVVDYYISEPTETVNFERGMLPLSLNVRNRGEVDVSLALILKVERANISTQTIKPWMDYNETELKIHVGLEKKMESYRSYEVYISPVNNPENFTVSYSIVNTSGFSISGIIGRLFLEPHGYYATHAIYNRTDTNTYEILT